jgi:transketolase
VEQYVTYDSPDFNVNSLQTLAYWIRRRTLDMIHRAHSSHIGSCFSVAELLAVLYGAVLKIDPSDPSRSDRDRFILSKGHACAALYATLAERGFFPVTWLDTFYQNGSLLSGHATTGVPGIELSTGSLGHGLSVGAGMALAAQLNDEKYRVFVLMSDGECDEGSNWEAILFAPNHKLDNLVAIVDYNKVQSLGTVEEVMSLDPLAEKWRSFGWGVREVDGHDVNQVYTALAEVPFEPGRPSCLIAHTVKGKGVSFMEGKVLWHYRSPQGEEYQLALAELEGKQ